MGKKIWSIECPSCKGDGFHLTCSTSFSPGTPCQLCNGEGRLALEIYEKCIHEHRHDCKKHGALISCITGYVDRRCDTARGLFARLLTIDEAMYLAAHNGVQSKMLAEHISQCALGTYKYKTMPVNLVPWEGK